MPKQAYFEDDGVGDWYRCVSATLAGESPKTNPEKWVKVSIPSIFERFIVLEACVALLGGDGQSDKRALYQAQANALLLELVHRHSDRGDFYRAMVLTR